ncbi:hypothetical protein GHT06_020141 [Daphnia sinensis]|uniref:DUF4806 domain-containing protein n=1 Tax=Daphnia sinensis TaxID=1820382 RepID=A0AAD5PS21_9CRUS|nr:hypothetical protein GHT06_020141 [Daphnia sinensis]
MAREVPDIKSENRDLRILLQRRQPIAGINNNNVGESRHPGFEKHVSLPLKTIDEFKHFEEELLKVEVSSNLDTIRRLWKEVMSNELMRLYTWSGTPKPNSGKQKGLAFEITTIPKIEETSKIYIRKAVDRLKSSSIAQQE